MGEPDGNEELKVPLSLDLLFAAGVVLQVAGAAMLIGAVAAYVRSLLT